MWEIGVQIQPATFLIPSPLLAYIIYFLITIHIRIAKKIKNKQRLKNK